MYASAWRAFQAWTQAREGLAMPAAPPLVADYLAHPAGERRFSVATLRLHKAAGRDDLTDNEGVKRVMQGISKTHGRAQKQARPLTAEGPGGDGWTSLFYQYRETDCCGADLGRRGAAPSTGSPVSMTVSPRFPCGLRRTASAGFLGSTQRGLD